MAKRGLIPPAPRWGEKKMSCGETPLLDRGVFRVIYPIPSPPTF